MNSIFSVDHADNKTKLDAAQNIKITLAINFLPLILGFLVVALTGQFKAAFMDVFLSGELYFYAMSFCAAIYVTSQLSTDNANASMRLWSGLFVICCSVFMAFFVGQENSPEGNEKIFHGLLSVIFLIIAIFINYRVLILANEPPPMPEDVHRNRASDIGQSVDPDYD